MADWTLGRSRLGIDTRLGAEPTEPASEPVLAPTATLDVPDSIVEDRTGAVSVSVEGGRYDSLEYAWELVERSLGSIEGNGASVVYRPPDITARILVAVQVTVTAIGTGTNAQDGSSASVSALSRFPVTPVVPPPDRPVAPPSTPPVVPTFGIASFDQTGLDIIALAVITSGRPEGNGTVYRSAINGGPLGSVSVGSDLEVATGQMITRIALNIQGSGNLRIWDNPSLVSWVDVFNDNPNYTVQLQFEGRLGGPYEFVKARQGGNFSTWTTSESIPQSLMQTARAAGEQFIIAITRPATGPPQPVTIDHAVDAGDVPFTFAVSQPGVTRTPVDRYTADPQDPSFIFVVSQPTVIRTRAARHTADAGGLSFTFATREPTVTKVSPGRHAVDPQDPSFTFVAGQPTVTRVQVNRHTIDAGDVPFLFVVRQPSITRVQPGGHSLDAGDAAFAFQVSQPGVTHTDTNSYSVNAGDASFTFRAGAAQVTVDRPDAHRVNPGDARFAFRPVQPAVTYVSAAAASFGLGSFDQTGLDVIALAEITSGRPQGNGTLFRSLANGGPLGSAAVDSDLEVQTTQFITRIAFGIDGPGSVRIWDNPSTLGWTEFFNDNPNYSLRLQFPDSGPFELDQGRQGGNFSSWSAGSADARAAITAARAAGAGQRFIIAIAQTSIAVQHQVDAGDVSFSFVSALVAVTKKEPNTHTVNVGSASFVVAVAQPTVTRIQPGTYRVGAGDVAFGFAIPEAGVSKILPEAHTVDAHRTVFVFTVSQPTITWVAPDSHLVDAGDLTFTFQVRQPTTATQGVASHAVDAGDAAFGFTISQVAVGGSLATSHKITIQQQVRFSFELPEPTITTTAAITVIAFAVRAGAVRFIVVVSRVQVQVTRNRSSVAQLRKTSAVRRINSLWAWREAVLEGVENKGRAAARSGRGSATARPVIRWSTRGTSRILQLYIDKWLAGYEEEDNMLSSGNRPGQGGGRS